MTKITQLFQKSQQVVDLAKLGVKIEKEEINLEKLYANLGRVFYKIHQHAPELIYDDLFRTIAGCQLQLNQVKTEYQQIKAHGKCQQCQAELKKSDSYCANCGQAVDK